MRNLTWMLCLTAVLQVSCSTSGAGQAKTPAAAAPEVVTRTRVVDTACDWTKPILVSKTDILSDDTARQILAHNLAGVKNCGWKAPGK